MSPPSLFPIPVPPASICLGLVGLQSNHLSHVNLQPNLGANRLSQFDNCFQICLFGRFQNTLYHLKKFSQNMFRGLTMCLPCCLPFRGNTPPYCPQSYHDSTNSNMARFKSLGCQFVISSSLKGLENFELTKMGV